MVNDGITVACDSVAPKRDRYNHAYTNDTALQVLEYVQYALYCVSQAGAEDGGQGVQDEGKAVEPSEGAECETWSVSTGLLTLVCIAFRISLQCIA